MFSFSLLGFSSHFCQMLNFTSLNTAATKDGSSLSPRCTAAKIDLFHVPGFCLPSKLESHWKFVYAFTWRRRKTGFPTDTRQPFIVAHCADWDNHLSWGCQSERLFSAPSRCLNSSHPQLCQEPGELADQCHDEHSWRNGPHQGTLPLCSSPHSGTTIFLAKAV